MLDMVRATPDYIPKYGSGAKDAAHYASTVCDQIFKIQEQKRSSASGLFESQLKSLMQMLEEVKAGR